MKETLKRHAFWTAVLATASLSVSCRPGDSTWLTYEEVFLQAGHDHQHRSAPAETAPARGRIAWTAPEGWQEEPASGMRMGAFTVQRGDAQATCTIISLSGPAGGMQANIQRWIGQLNLPALSSDELQTFMANLEPIETDEGLSGRIVDLGVLDPDAPEVILAGIFELPGTTLFVKFSGPRDLVEQEREAFEALSRSIRTGSGGAR